MKIRIKFQKQGDLKFIGHLDVMRTFQKLNRRAGIDIRYSGGFSPHQQMSFATPLGLGLTSTGEYVDLDMNTVPDKATFLKQLNDVNVEEMKLLDACLLPADAKNAMSLLAAADYTLRIREGHNAGEGFFEAFEAFLSQDSIPTVKKTKTGFKEVDLKQQIRAWKALPDGLFLQLDTGSVSNCRPEFVIETFYKAWGKEYDSCLFTVNRDELYGEEEGKLKKLIEYGTDF